MIIAARRQASDTSGPELAPRDVSSAQAAADSKNCPIEPLSQPFAPAEYGDDGFINSFCRSSSQSSAISCRSRMNARSSATLSAAAIKSWTTMTSKSLPALVARLFWLSQQGRHFHSLCTSLTLPIVGTCLAVEFFYPLRTNCSLQPMFRFRAKPLMQDSHVSPDRDASYIHPSSWSRARITRNIVRFSRTRFA